MKVERERFLFVKQVTRILNLLKSLRRWCLENKPRPDSIKSSHQFARVSFLTRMWNVKNHGDAWILRTCLDVMNPFSDTCFLNDNFSSNPNASQCSTGWCFHDRFTSIPYLFVTGKAKLNVPCASISHHRGLQFNYISLSMLLDFRSEIEKLETSRTKVEIETNKGI